MDGVDWAANFGAINRALLNLRTGRLGDNAHLSLHRSRNRVISFQLGKFSPVQTFSENKINFNVMKRSTLWSLNDGGNFYSLQALVLTSSIPCVILHLLARYTKYLCHVPATSSIFIPCLELSLMQPYYVPRHVSPETALLWLKKSHGERGIYDISIDLPAIVSGSDPFVVFSYYHATASATDIPVELMSIVSWPDISVSCERLLVWESDLLILFRRKDHWAASTRARSLHAMNLFIAGIRIGFEVD